MTLVVLGIDALDPDIVDERDHSNLCLERHTSIETLDSSAGVPSTHELWPSIITGLRPEEHGLELDDGVAWENRYLRLGSLLSDYLLPNSFQTYLGTWLLNNTSEDAFRMTSSYYSENGISTVFDGRDTKSIGVPNYVTDPDVEDREHRLRNDMGEYFERNPTNPEMHESADPSTFYELCMEMSMVRIARTRRALRSRNYELVFGYTSGLDLIGHVSYDLPELQKRAYDEMDDFVGELRDDLDEDDELLLVSDHGLQDGVHTHEAMVAGTNPDTVEAIKSVLDVKDAVESTLNEGSHEPQEEDSQTQSDSEAQEEVKEQLEDLGYM